MMLRTFRKIQYAEQALTHFISAISRNTGSRIFGKIRNISSNRIGLDIYGCEYIAHIGTRLIPTEPRHFSSEPGSSPSQAADYPTAHDSFGSAFSKFLLWPGQVRILSGYLHRFDATMLYSTCIFPFVSTKYENQYSRFVCFVHFSCFLRKQPPWPVDFLSARKLLPLSLWIIRGNKL